MLIMQLSSTPFARPLFVISLFYFCFATSISAFRSFPHAQALSTRNKPELPLSVEVIYEFPPGTWLENIAVRRNGQILTTVLTAPEIYQVDPCQKRDPILLYSFPATSVFGIAELQPDVFYVAVGNATLSSVDSSLSSVPGSFSVWKLDLRSFSVTLGKPVEVTKIATITGARLLDGVAVLDARQGLLLIADPLLGRIWQLNVYTREINIFSDDPLVQAPADSPLPFGVNGIQVRHGAVYFSNSIRNIIGRIDEPAVVVVEGFGVIDDFAIGSNGAFFVADNLGGALVYAPAAGGESTIIANITTNPTAVAFGRRSEDAQSVYVSTAGGPPQAFASSSPPRGQILKLDVSAFLNDYRREY